MTLPTETPTAPRLDVVHTAHGYIEAQRLFTLVEVHAVNTGGGDCLWLTAAECRAFAAVLIAEADTSDEFRQVAS